MKISSGKVIKILLTFILCLFLADISLALDRDERRAKDIEALQEKFSWWPTDAKPGPVKDERGGYWWWPTQPGSVGPLWGNRGYCFVYKVIFDYKEEELPPPKAKEMRPSLLIKKIIKNVKIYFDYNKYDIRDDAIPILEGAVKALNKNSKADILITGNCDRRGSESYNEKLGKKRAESVKDFLTEKGIPDSHIKIISQGKLNAVAPITDVIGMEKDRNAQFMIAEVEEVMIPYEGEVPPEAQKVEESKFVEEEVAEVQTSTRASTKEYTVQKGDSLWKIAKKELNNGDRWKYLYELNKDKIKDPNKLKPGIKILIPVE